MEEDGMRRMNCRKCGAKVRHVFGPHVERVGEIAVKDWTGVFFTCVRCGSQFCSKKTARMYKQRAAALILEDDAKASGYVVAFAREALGLRQRQLAKMLGRPVIDIMHWETGETEVPRRDQKAMADILNVVLHHGLRALKYFSIPSLKESAP